MSNSNPIVCPRCYGVGDILEHPEGVYFSQTLADMITCADCDGSGRVKTCPACDGEGSTSFEWAKETCIRTNGRRIDFTGDRAWEGWYYITGEGKEIEFKTIGGPCSVCNGKKVVPALSE
jgi:RecJ-like exonuclease